MIDAALYQRDRFFTDRDGALSLRLRSGEVNDFSRNWTHLLSPGETILESAWESDAGGVMTHGSDGRITTVWLEEAALALVAPAAFATLVNTIETSDGRQDSWTVRVYPPA
jgi:hypothetical protein